MIRLEPRDDIGIIWINDPEASVNALRADLADQLGGALDRLREDDRLIGGVIASDKPDSFVVGADIDALVEVLGNPDGARRLIEAGQQAMETLASFPKPLVAAIHGSCLGGGLELALACSARVASEDPRTRLGLPEVRLGVIPAAGGTQRLPEAIGLERALDLILSGRDISARRAFSWGLVDEVVHPAILLDVAVEHARDGRSGRSATRRGGLEARRLVLEANPAGRRLVFRQAAQRVQNQTQGNMPAPLEALQAIEVGVDQGRERGLAAEVDAFARLVAKPETAALIGVFRGRTRANRRAREAAERARSVSEVVIVGAGLMGSGIAGVTASHMKVPVVLTDVSDQALRAGLTSIRQYLDHRVRSGRMSEHERDRAMASIHATRDEHRNLGRVDLVIEAVVEDLEVKRQVLAAYEERTKTDAIFASNTSSIPIARLAETSTRPGQVVGMHYFSPVPQIPLLEVIRHAGTEEWVVDTAVDVGRRQGKTVIVVNDGPGFYTSRILAPFIDEAGRLVAEGAEIEQVDRVIEALGFPVGPLRLADEVGLDTGAEIAGILREAFGDRIHPHPLILRMVEDGRRGRKNGRGFYRYEPKAGRFQRVGPDDSVYALGESERTPVADPEIAERCLLSMLNEAAWTLEEGIIADPIDGDVGAVFGLGFPPHLGGPFRELDRRGPSVVSARLRELSEAHGPRFLAPPLLESRGSFHTG